jgi:hypothetical protein
VGRAKRRSEAPDAVAANDARNDVRTALLVAARAFKE